MSYGTDSNQVVKGAVTGLRQQSSLLLKTLVGMTRQGKIVDDAERKLLLTSFHNELPEEEKHAGRR